MADQLGDYALALRMKEVVARLVREELDRQRPPVRFGRVYDFNRFTMRALVLFVGDTDPTPVMMMQGMQPTGRILSDGEAGASVVRVEGTPGNLWITGILNGPDFQYNTQLSNPNLRGGQFLHQRVASFFNVSTGLPAMGNTYYIGKFTNEESFGSDGLATVELWLQLSFFASVAKKYVLTIRSNDTSDTWKKCAPTHTSGPWASNDFELEIKTGGNSIEFRIRRTRENVGGFSPGGYDLSVWFYGQDWKQDLNSPTAEDSPVTTAPNSTWGISSSDEAKGPFHSPAAHLPQLNQALLSGGGVVTYNATTDLLKWTSRFICMGAGRNYFQTSGFFDIPVPAGGVSIPVLGKTSETSRNTSVSGVTLSNWEALYYEIPYGSGSTGIEANFRIVNYNDSAKQFEVPSHWTLVAVHNNDGPESVKLGNGEIVLTRPVTGYVAKSERNSQVTGITTTETVVQSIAFNALIGVRYKISAIQNYQSNVLDDLTVIRLRWEAGGTLTTSGTQIAVVAPNCARAGKGEPAFLEGDFIAPSTGQMVVGVTAIRDATATGTITMHGSANQVNTIYVEAVGA